MYISGTVLQMSRFRTWLFLYATRVIEFVNGCFIIGFSTIFILDMLFGSSHIYEMSGYSSFRSANGFLWVLLFLLGIAQIAAMSFYSIRSNKISGLILIMSSVIWALIAVNFYSSRGGVVTAGIAIYSIWSLMTLVTGYEILSVNKKIEVVLNREA